MDRLAHQIGALPYRISGTGIVEVLLVTSRGSGQWVVPKGNRMPGLSDARAAAQEAFEEAGVIGRIESRPVGTYVYEKIAKDASQTTLTVAVFPLLVDRQLTYWPEALERRQVWTAPTHALTLVNNPSLRVLLKLFENSCPRKARSVAYIPKLGKINGSAAPD